MRPRRTLSRGTRLFAVWFAWAVGTVIWTLLASYGRQLTASLLLLMALGTLQTALAVRNALRYCDDRLGKHQQQD
jgi:hypothetical protein